MMILAPGLLIVYETIVAIDGVLLTMVDRRANLTREVIASIEGAYIMSFTLIFGTVKAGFCQVTQPQIFVTVKTGLPNGYQFANRCDVGGKYNGEWVVGASSWVTTVYAPPTKLPRTGY